VTLYDRRYVLHERLGVGGMGEVYRATDRLAGRSVALKRVLTSATDPAHATLGRRAALADEFQILASLRHPNIVSVLDYGFDADQRPYFTMALLQGPRTFARYALTRPVPERMALVVEILRALAYLHRRGIVHRDLKPGNVLVDADGRVRVLDFGIAVGRGSDHRMAGTVGYIAPEVLQGESATEASDLFAVGVMAFEVLTGARPFFGPDTQSVVEAVLHGEPDFARLSRAVASPLDPATAEDRADLPTSPPVAPTEAPITVAEEATRAFDPTSAAPGVATVRAAVPPATTLVGVIRRLLARDPRDRYSNAATVVREISAVMGTPLPAETADTRESFLQAAPLIGRDEERRRLLGALEKVSAGRGRVLLVGGESGVGKSRLLDELRTAALVRGVNVAQGQAVSEGGAPYQLWRGPLRQLIVLSEPTDFQAGVVKAVVPDVEMLLDRPVADPPPVSTDARQERLQSVIEQLFEVRTPTLVVLEDLHWAPDGAALLRRLVAVAARAPLLIVGSYRQDEARSLPEQVAGAERMDLDRLSLASVAALTEAMLGSVPGREKLVEYLHRETEGNAFFLVEVVRALAEQAGELDDVARMALPERVLSGGMRQLIGQRLERVPAEHRERLRLAAVLGRELDLAALGAGAGDHLDEWLLACSAASVLEVQRDRWRFSHDKLRETLVAALSDSERVTLHQQAAAGLEAAYPDRGAHAAALAHHWGVAGNRIKEALYAALGGQRAVESAAFPEAVALLTRALDLATADSSLPVEIAPTSRLLGEALLVTGHFEEARDRLERAVRHLGGPVPTLSAGRTSVILAGQVVRQVLHRLVPSYFIGRARTPDARARMLLLSRAYERIGHCHYMVGRSLPTVCASLLNLNSSEQAGPSIELARSYGTQILGAGMVGQHRMARMYMRLARQAEDGITDQAALGWVDLMAVTYLVGAGAWAEMDEIIPRATALQEALGDRRRLQETVMVGACGDYFRGRFAESLVASGRVWSLAVDAEGWQPRVWSTAGLVQAGLVTGAADTLRRLTGNTVVGQTWHSIDGLWLAGALARCYLRVGNLEAARIEAERALALMPKTPPVAGYVLEGYAGATEVQIALWARAVPPAARTEAHAAARRGLSTIERFAGMFPVGEPRAALCRGLYERVLQRDTKAAAAFERGRAAGERLQMPYEAALASVELGLLLGPRDSRGVTLLDRAYQTFDALGAAEDARLTLRRRRESEAAAG
jgi:serine/threonine protein kinase/tetratricopeptide (TPR) repeat protein